MTTSTLPADRRGYTAQEREIVDQSSRGSRGADVRQWLARPRRAWSDVLRPKGGVSNFRRL